MADMDFTVLKGAAESRDADIFIDLYADNAEVRIVNKTSPPGSPRVIRGRDAIAEWLRDVFSRDMTHEIGQEVIGDSRISYTEACQYATGERVLSAAVADLNDEGKIASHLMIETWDE